jgi:hypothetical protein
MLFADLFQIHRTTVSLHLNRKGRQLAQALLSPRLDRPLPTLRLDQTADQLLPTPPAVENIICATLDACATTSTR